MLVWQSLSQVILVMLLLVLLLIMRCHRRGRMLGVVKFALGMEKLLSDLILNWVHPLNTLLIYSQLIALQSISLTFACASTILEVFLLWLRRYQHLLLLLLYRENRDFRQSWECKINDFASSISCSDLLFENIEFSFHFGIDVPLLVW